MQSQAFKHANWSSKRIPFDFARTEQQKRDIFLQQCGVEGQDCLV